jgi:sugar phosphate isomerase/epimerase
MKVGMMTNPATDLYKQIEWLGKHKFDFLDLNLTCEQSRPAEFKPAQIKQALADHGLGVVVQGPHYLPIASPLEAIRRAAASELVRYVDLVAELGSSLLSVHYNYPAPDFHVEQILDWHTHTLQSVCQHADAVGVTLAIENSSFGGKHQLLNIESLLKRMSSLRVHLSNGHARLEHEVDRFDAYIQRFSSRICHVHLSENDGTGDRHLPFGAGPRSNVDWHGNIRLLRRSGYDGTITLKVFSPEREYVLLSRDLLNRWCAAAGATTKKDSSRTSGELQPTFHTD